MGMKACLYVPIKIVVHKVEHSQQIIFIHGSQSIDQIKGKGIHAVYPFDKLQQSLVGIGRSSDGLDKYLIALIFKLLGKCKGFSRGKRKGL